MKTNKPINKKKVLSIVGTVTVVAIFVLVIVFAFVGSPDNTRTHFSTVTSDKRVTDTIVYDGDESIFNDNEYVAFEFDIVDRKDAVFDDTFKEWYPEISKLLTDKNFCASQTDIKNLTFDHGVLVVDSYSYTPDYSIRFLDMLYVPYIIEDNRSITLSKPKRLTVKYDTNLAQVSYCELDKQNFRVSPYNICLNVTAGNKAEKWDITSRLNLRTGDGEIAKSISQKASFFNKQGQSIASVSAGTKYIDYTATISADGTYKLKLDFDDEMFDNFENINVLMKNERMYACDSATFFLTINEQ